MVCLLLLNTALNNSPYLVLHLFRLYTQCNFIIFHSIDWNVLWKVKNILNSHCQWINAFNIFDSLLHLKCFEALIKHFFKHLLLNIIRLLLLFLFIILLLMKHLKLLNIFLSYLMSVDFLFIPLFQKCLMKVHNFLFVIDYFLHFFVKVLFESIHHQ